MKNVFFKPWIGCNYSSGGIFPKRVLVLGESYYQKRDDEPLYPEITTDFINAQIKGEGTLRFFTSVVRTFRQIDGPLTPDDKSKFWNSVIHYTFVQTPVGSGPRKRPTPEMWQNGQALFLEVLKEHEPDFIIAFGRELWSNLPSADAGPEIKGAKQSATCWYPAGQGKVALAYGIPHPSSGRFSANYWRPFVAEAMELA